MTAARPSTASWSAYTRSIATRLRAAGCKAGRLACAEATLYKLLPLLSAGRWEGSGAELVEVLARGHQEEAARSVRILVKAGLVRRGRTARGGIWLELTPDALPPWAAGATLAEDLRQVALEVRVMVGAVERAADRLDPPTHEGRVGIYSARAEAGVELFSSP